MNFSIQDQFPPVTTLSSSSRLSPLSFNITLLCSDDNSGVSSGCRQTYYTTDGSDPTIKSEKYENAITLNESSIIKFFSDDIAGYREGIVSKRFYIGDTDSNEAMRIGELSITSEETSKNFASQISDPIILLGTPTFRDHGAGVSKIISVTENSVTALFAEWESQDGIHAQETVPYVAFTKGKYLLNNGDEIEVGRANLSSSQQWQDISFESPFSDTPQVILTSQSDSNNKVFNLLSYDITNTGFSTKLVEQESNAVIDYSEAIGYLAYYKNELNPIDQNDPLVTSSTLEVNSDWTVFDVLGIRLQEEASFDEELVHISELISIVNINGALLLQQVGELEADTSSLRRSILDTDLDGLVDVIDTDDDNDGVSDSEDAFSTKAAAAIDTDLDGLPDRFLEYCDLDCISISGLTLDLDDDNDLVLDVDDAFPLDFTESLDTDSDGTGNNADNDDDADGIIDEDDSAPLNSSIGDEESPVFSDIVDVTFEATGFTTDIELVIPDVTDNNLNDPTIVSDYSEALSLGVYEIEWTATDFAGNVTKALQLVTIVDTTVAKFDEVPTQIIDAKAVFNDISVAINNVQAYDLVDGNISAVVVGEQLYKSGAHFLTVSATDSSGNVAETDVELHINPLVELSQSRKVEPGATVVLPVMLSGNAATYPVEVTYALMQSGSVIKTYELLIIEDISGAIAIDVPSDALSGDIFSVAITSVNNAVLGFVTSTRLTVDEANFAPTITLVTQQDGKNISVVDGQGGVITLTAFVQDINVNDTHDITWNPMNDALVDLNTDALASTFEFLAEGLMTGTYELTVSVRESNTTELYGVSADRIIVVDDLLPPLDVNTDSDNDGVLDAIEGYSDSDQDGISDYLDDDNNPSRLPIDDSTRAMQTLNGLSLSLGDLVSALHAASAKSAAVDASNIAPDKHFTVLSEITNFNVSGLTEVGQSVPVVIPLTIGDTISEGNIYRKYSKGKGWFDFVVDSENGVYSALSDEDGNCPYPLSAQYQEGLTVDNNCIQLLIKDGGENDADGLVNGIVKDPGVLTSEVINQAPEIDVNTYIETDEGSVVRLDASATTDAENDTLTYQWVQLSGSTVELLGQNTDTSNFTSPFVSNDELLTFELTVNDGRDSATIVVEVLIRQVNIAPTVSIDSHSSSYDEGSTISLTATAADEDNDALSYEWKQKSGPTVVLSGDSGATVSFNAPQVSSEQDLEFTVAVSDGIDVVYQTTVLTVKNITSLTPPTESGESGGSMGWILLAISVGLLRKLLIKTAA